MFNASLSAYDPKADIGRDHQAVGASALCA
jgi:hypothetical protein